MSSYGHIVLANSKKGVVPAIIRYVTKSQYSHSLLTIPNILEVPMCVEAADSGVSMLRFDRGYTENKDQEIAIFSVNISQEDKDKAIIQCLNSLQLGYGYLELFWFIWRAFNKFIGRDIKNQDNWVANGIICSELCRMYLSYAGLGHLFKEFGNGALNAEDLRQIMLDHPDVFTEIKKKI